MLKGEQVLKQKMDHCALCFVSAVLISVGKRFFVAGNRLSIISFTPCFSLTQSAYQRHYQSHYLVTFNKIRV